MEQINLEQITDLKELKAMVYDESIALGHIQKNLEMLNNRIAQVQAMEAEPKEAEPKEAEPKEAEKK